MLPTWRINFFNFRSSGYNSDSSVGARAYNGGRVGARAYNGGLGAEQGPEAEPQPVMVRGRSPLKLKAFRLFSYKRAKSLVFKLKKTPMFGPWGVAAAWSAHT